MSHYDTLGVKRDATPDEIKAAYRRAAAAAHPDREGGSTARMQAVNRANDVLSNPEKRAHYDATGQDANAGPTIEDRALELLLTAFEEAIDKEVEPVNHARTRLAEVRKKLERMQAEATVAGEKLSKRLGRTKVKGDATNLVEQLLQRRIDTNKRKAEQMTEALAANAKAAELLEVYVPHPEDAFAGLDELQQRQQMHALQAAMASMGIMPGNYR